MTTTLWGHEEGNVIKAYTKPKIVVMVPAYINKEIEGKRKWIRVGMYCPECGSFESKAFRANRHAV
jgi:hypothetical protein